MKWSRYSRLSAVDARRQLLVMSGALGVEVAVVVLAAVLRAFISR